ncbi:MAG: hypothetical protein KKD24_00170 [Proteobacteria bacterium]|nr:hypothetical protein [Pseudomonadota bacterium]
MTPDMIRKRDEAVASVGKYWYLDFETKEIRRKPQNGVAALNQFFWKKRHTVWQFYVWLRHRQAEEDAMPFPDQIDSDNIPLKGYPKKYELKGGWTIPRNDLAYLTHGPLASEGRHEVLVPETNRWQSFLLVAKQAGILIGAGVTAIGACVRWWSELSIVFAKLF